MKILKHDEIHFEKSPTGGLNCRLKDGTVHEHLHCVTLFPLTIPEKFISVIKETGPDIEEIGVIPVLDGFSDEQKQFVRRAIDERYFVPEIMDIEKLKSKMTRRGHGFEEWKIKTDRGEKMLYLFNPKENMSINNAGVIIITDIEKSRYKISDLEKLPQKARIIIEQLLL